MHQAHCSDLESQLANYNASTNGVTKKSILINSCYFHVVDGMAPDVMHDILEGVMQFGMMMTLKTLILRSTTFSRQL